MEYTVSVKGQLGRRELLIKAETVQEAIFNAELKIRGTDDEITAVNPAK